MQDLSGKTIRSYRLLERIGSGGFGAVYRALQPSVDREVAIKVVLPEFVDHPDFVGRFEAEARTVARLEHPHIVPLYEYWHDQEGAFLVMRYLRGGSLYDRLQEHGPIPLPEARRILGQVCEALAAAHEQGVIHRDLKPENVLLDERGQAYLGDFGIAKQLGGERLTRAGMLMGSAAYLAPEQAKGEDLSPQTDIYGLGVVLFEMVTGEHPFPDLDPVQLVQRHLSQPLPPVDRFATDLPASLDGLIQRATAKDPVQRHRSALEFLEELRAALDQAPAADAAPAREPAFLREDAPEPAPPPVFVGRERELIGLERLLQQTVEGQGRVAMLVGGAGQGKTALAQAFARRAVEANADLLVAYGDCNAQSGIGDPYLPFREALHMLCGEVESSWSTGKLPPEAARRLWNAVPATAQALMEMGPDLLDLLVPSTPLRARAAEAPVGARWASDLETHLARRATSLPASSLKQIDLFEQLTRVLRKLSEQFVLLLIFDDFQWSDDASISLLFHLSRRISDRRILLLCAYRPDEIALGRDGGRHPFEQVANELKRLHGEIVVDLAESQDGAAFIDSLLDSEPNLLGPEFRTALLEHTDGHPLFTVELLRAMQEGGSLRPDAEGRWIAEEKIDWDQLPPRAEAVIEERIGRLEGEIRETLSIASVEGNDFTAQVLARVQKVEERKLLRDLSQELLKRHRLIRELGEIKTGRQMLSRYQFAHHLFQRYLYNGLSTAERRLLHGEIAEVLEDIFAEEVERVAVQLAYHARRASLQDKAVRYLRIAGNQAKASYANQEAVRHYGELISLLVEDGEELFDALAARTEVNGLIGNRDVQLADIDAMSSLAERLGDGRRQVMALLAQADYHLETEHVLAEQPAQAALELAQQLDDPVLEAGALRRLGWGEWLRTNYTASREHLEAAVQRFRQANLKGEAATCLHMLSLALADMMDPAGAQTAAEEAVELSRQVGDRRQEATGLRRIAIALLNQSAFEEALSFAEQALALHREVGDWSEEAHALNVLGILYAWLGRWEESETSYRMSLQIGRDLHSTTAVQFATWNLIGSHYARIGAYEDALRLIEGELEQAMAAEDEWLVGALHWQKGDVLHEFGQYDAAATAHSVAHTEILRLAPGGHLEVSVESALALDHAGIGDIEAAKRHLSRAAEASAQLTNPSDRFGLDQAEAELSLLLHEQDRFAERVESVKAALEITKQSYDAMAQAEFCNLAARLSLAQGDLEGAHALSVELAGLLDDAPSLVAPHDYAYTHAQVLEARGEHAEARAYFKRAYDRVLLVAESFQDDELRRSWLQTARRNAEILTTAAKLGIA